MIEINWINVRDVHAVEELIRSIYAVGVDPNTAYKRVQKVIGSRYHVTECLYLWEIIYNERHKLSI